MILLVWSLGRVSPAGAQSGTSIVEAGARYETGFVGRLLLGSDYRHLWSTPIEVELLDLERFAGGLRPLRRGGGRQTRSLRMMGEDGREYAFRSVDKVPELSVHPDLEGALVGRLIQDQVSSQLPAAPLVAARISTAAGLLAPAPRLFLMPDDPLLGPFRTEFAGMLGTLEEHADESEDGAEGFAGFARIAGTETVLDNLEDSSDHRIDARTYLAARLIDLLLGDWDRHADQWRWGRHESDGAYFWIPIARDRDYAFSDYDGLLLRIVRAMVPNAVRFGESYPLEGLLMSAGDLDRQLLSGLQRPVWDSVAVALQGRLTDAAIDAAFLHMPSEFQDLESEALARVLKARRDRLPIVAGAFYRRLARVAEVRTTDEDEVAEVYRHADGSVEVRVESGRGSAQRGDPYYHRVFSPGETREVRLYLRGGDDLGVVRGRARRGILVRVIGGGGEDVLVDSSSVARRGRWTAFYDSGSADRLVTGAATLVDRREYEQPDAEPRGLIRIPPLDSGTGFTARPLIDYSTTRGLLIGGAVTATRYDFRRHPHAARTSVGLYYAPSLQGFGLRARSERRSHDPSLSGSFELIASEVDAIRFYGFGNETPVDPQTEQYVVNRDFAWARAEIRKSAASFLRLAGGLDLRYSSPALREGSPLERVRPTGAGSYRAMGLVASVDLRPPRDSAAAALRIDTSAFPSAWSSAAAYGSIGASGGLRLPRRRDAAHLLVRGGARHVWGDYPFFDAAFLGGSATLRGYPEWRFAGDSMIHGTLEAVAPLGRLRFLMNWKVEGIALADVGRVFVDGERSGTWHPAGGAGLSLSALEYAVRLTYARGESSRFYLEAAAPF